MSIDHTSQPKPPTAESLKIRIEQLEDRCAILEGDVRKLQKELVSLTGIPNPNTFYGGFRR